jgi:OOP family OmpA-OmpF porin
MKNSILAVLCFFSFAAAAQVKKDTVLPKQTDSPQVYSSVDTVPYTPFKNIQFEFDSSMILRRSLPTLDDTSYELRTKGGMCEIAGFASSEGSAAYNLRLAMDRATMVKNYLVSSGVAAKKLKVKSYGIARPLADNSTEEGRVLNRRVELKKE